MEGHTDIRASAVTGREAFPQAESGHPPVPRGVSLGARLLTGDRCEFRVWAPARETVHVHTLGPHERRILLHRIAGGYHEGIIGDCPEGTRYLFVLDGATERPDPASRYQPDGVHGPSMVIGSEYPWRVSDWGGVALEDLVIYELHVGTFTSEGTFDAVIPRLDALRRLGVTAIELLPVAQFPGERNWGYDGTYVGAAQTSYGGPLALKRLVDACHERGLAILLDVVYNHLGPEGNYLAEYGPYFTDRYKTPWGLALNFDGPQSDDVRWFFIHNALQWIDEFRFDGLRVDAVHAIVDHSAEPFLQDLTVAVHERGEGLGRPVWCIAESDLNDPRVITSRSEFGLGFDSQWSDDFHHSLHTILTGERDGYYEGFSGKPGDLARVMTTGYLYTGQHSPYRGRKYGLRPGTKNGACFVVSAQNHDQVGNRMLGERLASIVSPPKLQLAAAAIILSPFLPMLFMGEEYGETAPFQYFTSHSDPGLIEAVRHGRREEFDEFAWQGEPPDPDAVETFERSKLNPHSASQGDSAALQTLYTDLIRLRRERPALRSLDLGSVNAQADDERMLLLVERRAQNDRVLVAFNFSEEEGTAEIPFEVASWKPLLANQGNVTAGRIVLPALSFAVFGA